MADTYSDPFGLDDRDDAPVNYNDVDLFDLSKRRRHIEAVRSNVDNRFETEYIDDFDDFDDIDDFDDVNDFTDDESDEVVVRGSSTGRRRKPNGSITGVYVTSDEDEIAPRNKDKCDFNFNTTKFVKYVLIAAIMCVIIGLVLVHDAVSRVNYTDITCSGNTSPAQDAPDWNLRNQWGVTNILLLGIDGDGGSNQRSDTIMLLTLDENNNQIKMTSILRDTYVSVPGRKNKTRINHAYAYGGAALTMQTIESNFRIDMKKYIGVDMDGLSVVVEKLGGVDITLSAAEAKTINQHVKGSSLVEGKQHLNGAQATYYARIRKLDSDFGRTSRQRNLIKAMLTSFKKLGIVEQYSLISETAPYLTTNYTQAELVSVALKMIGLLDAETDEMCVPVKGTYKSRNISGMAVLVPDIEKNCEKMHRFIFGSLPD